jgi:hypothetical protein
MFIAEPEFVNLNFFKEPRTRFRNRFRNRFLASLKVYKFRLLCNSTVCGRGEILGDQYSNTSSVTRYRNYRIRELWEFILRLPSTIVREKCGSLSSESFNGVRELWEFIPKAFHWCQKNVGVHPKSFHWFQRSEGGHPKSLPLASDKCGRSVGFILRAFQWVVQEK